MGRILVYSGEISVTGSDYIDGEYLTFFRATRTIYGKTIGEYLDNMVTVAATIQPDVEKYVLEKKPEGYLLSDDYWMVNTERPSLLFEDDNYTTYSGSSISSSSDILKVAVHQRYLEITASISQLNWAGDHKYSRIDSGKFWSDYDDIFITKLEPVEKLAKLGEYFDTIRETAEKNGDLAKVQTLYKIRTTSLKTKTEKADRKPWFKRNRFVKEN